MSKSIRISHSNNSFSLSGYIYIKKKKTENSHMRNINDFNQWRRGVLWILAWKVV